jgi:Cu/Ag efflux protein CusF
MNRSTLTVALAALAVVVTPPARAQAAHDHATPAAAPASTMAKSAPAEGEVRALDRAKGTIVLKHGPLNALNMGPMTMEFVARPPALLATVKVGDKVRFTPAQGKDGALVLTTLEIVRN